MNGKGPPRGGLAKSINGPPHERVLFLLIFSIFYSIPACIRFSPCCEKKFGISLIFHLHCPDIHAAKFNLQKVRKLIRVFLRSMGYALCKSKSSLFSRKMQIFFDASARDPRIKLCPQRQSFGATSDFTGRPASACRSSPMVCRDRGLISRINARCEEA